MRSTSSINPYALGTAALPADFSAFILPDWDKLSHPDRLKVLRQMAESAGRDPRLRLQAVNILRAAGAESRDYTAQADALLAWVQDHIYYVNEPGEQLQDPLYTLTHRFGDCDDASVLLMSFYEAIGLPWKFTISGKTFSGRTVKWVEGTSAPWGVRQWGHIFGMVGDRPFSPTTWRFVEPTVKNAPLGWDVSMIPRSPTAAFGFAGYGSPFGFPGANVPATTTTGDEPHFFSKTTAIQIGVYVIAGFFSAIAGAIALELYAGARHRAARKGWLPHRKNGRRRRSRR